MAAEPPSKKVRVEAADNYLQEMCKLIKDFEANMLDQVKAVREKYREIDYWTMGPEIRFGDEEDTERLRAKCQKLYEPVHAGYVEEIGLRAKTLHETLKPVIEKAFKQHDTNDTNVLDKEEAATFWDQLMDEQSVLAQDLWHMRVVHKIDVDYTMRGIHAVTGGEDVARMDRQNKEFVKKMLDEYKAKKVERNAAAFKIVDVNGDGTLQLSELTGALLPGSEKHKQLMQTLGLLNFDPSNPESGHGESKNYPGGTTSGVAETAAETA
jgi:hypothetical protein